MPTVCKVSLDATQYKQELAEITSQTEKSTQNIEKSFSTGGDGAKKLTKETKNSSSVIQKTTKDSKELDDSMKRTFGSAAEDAKKAAGVVGSVNGALGATAPQLTVIGDLIESAILGPIGLVVAAIGGLISLGVALWDKFTISAEEYASKAQIAVEKSQKYAEEVKSLETAMNGYLEILRAINNLETSNATTRESTIRILQLLQSHYGNLGAEIDSATGKLTNFWEVQQRVRGISSGRQVVANEKTIKGLQDQATAKFMSLHGYLDAGTEKDSKKLFKNMLSSYSSEETIKFIDANIKNSTNHEEIQGYSEVRSLLVAINDLTEKNNNLRKTGFSTEEELLQSVQSRIAAEANASKMLEDAQNIHNRQLQDDKFNELEDFDAKKANRQELLDDELAKQEQINKELEKAKEHFLKVKKELEEARKNNSLSTENITLKEGELADAKKQELDIELKLQNSKSKSYSLQKQINDLEKEKIRLAGLVSTQPEQSNQSEKSDLSAYFASKANTLLSQSVVSKDKTFSEQLALKEAENQKGGELTTEESDLVKKLNGLSHSMSNISDLKLGGFDIKTNALTGRGGFQTGAVISKSDDINNQIMNYNKEQLNVQTELCDLVKKLGFF